MTVVEKAQEARPSNQIKPSVGKSINQSIGKRETYPVLPPFSGGIKMATALFEQ